MPSSDSLEVLNRTAGLEEYYQDPLKWKSQLPNTSEYLDSLHSAYPENRFLGLQYANVLDHLSYYVMLRRDLENALEILNKSLELKQRFKAGYELPITYLNYAHTWWTQLDFEQGKEYLDKAKELAKESGNEKVLWEVMADEATYYRMKAVQIERNPTLMDSLLTEALMSFKSVVKGAEKRSYHSIAGKCYRNISLIKGVQYNMLKEQGLDPDPELLDQSLHYLSKADSMYSLDSNLIGLETVYSSYGVYYTRIGDPEKAIPFYEKSRDMLEEFQDSVRLKVPFYSLSIAYYMQEKFEDAFVHLHVFYEIDRATTDRVQYQNMTRLKAEEQLKAQNKLDSLEIAKNLEIEKQVSLRKANQKSWILGFISFTFIALFVIVYFRNKAKTHRVALELRKRADENEELSQIVTQKSEQVSTLLNNTLKELKKKEQLAENIKKLSKDSGDVSLKSVLADLNADKLEDSNKLFFHEKMKGEHDGFLQRLKEKHPNLSATEVELLSFVRLGFSRKQIATHRNTTTAAVKMGRYRAKKKLNIGQEESLDQYIRDL